MDLVSPAGPVYQAGTLSGNPLAMTAGLWCLHNLPPNLIRAKLEAVYTLFEQHGLRPTSFRGGRFSTGEVVQDFLRDKRFGADASVLPTGARSACDATGEPVVLFPDEWSCNFFAQRNPKVRLAALPFEAVEAEAVA